MSAQQMPWISERAYLHAERQVETKSEYLNGEVFALSGGSLPHGVLIGALSREFGNLLESRPCMVSVSDVRLRVAASGLYTYPDLMITCDPPQLLDEQKDTLLNPCVVAEDLSPSTA